MAVEQLTEQAVLAVLSTVKDPELHRGMVELKMIQDVTIVDSQTIGMRVVLTTPACPLKNRIHDDIDAALATLPGSPRAQIKWDSQVSRPGNIQARQQIEGVKNIVSVGAGKGGVGKSTCAVNIALALSQLGARTGVLDADVYGPNVPILLGAEHEKPYAENEKIIPIQRYGIKIISLAFFIEPDKAAIWRGPMLSGAVRQFLFDVNWGELDYLIVDLPPGTGDVQLTMSQSIPMTGAVVVSTPQDVATADVGRAIQMFNTLKVPNLGLVENMSFFVCPHCGQREEIFGHGGAKALAERTRIPFLGEIPLDRKIREGGGPGVPLMVSEPDSSLASVYRDVAQHLAAQVSIRNFKQASVIPLRTI
ncbi:MAG TPA: iron-sulfur cluster carrier protein ApbC [Candidatus Acidoferrum sp.]|nr:iron-sulfur cluster carrier protein ApbC [Candidatus Acidoferrum sp.]